jgi:hypothetical protein
MKPSLGRTVYKIHHDILIVDEVYMVGKDSFIIGGTNNQGRLESWECFYDQYNIVWFTSFARAKKAILKSNEAKHYINPKLVKMPGGYYELQEETYGEKGKWPTVNT